MLRTTPLALFALVLTEGCVFNRPISADPAEMATRYSHMMGVQECFSWLRSHKTGFLYCASPAFEVEVEPTYELVVEVPCPKDDAGMVARGKATYDNVCAVCHQADGQGTEGTYPPLAGAGEYYGDAKNHAGIIVNGLQGEITVLGKTYNSVMAPHGHLTDCDIAAVASYERNSWGNNDGIVTPADVAAVR